MVGSLLLIFSHSQSSYLSPFLKLYISVGHSAYQPRRYQVRDLLRRGAQGLRENLALVKSYPSGQQLMIFIWRIPIQNFLVLCASGYYDGMIFHRNIKGFMIQGGDPTGMAKGALVYGERNLTIRLENLLSTMLGGYCQWLIVV